MMRNVYFWATLLLAVGLSTGAEQGFVWDGNVSKEGTIPDLGVKMAGPEGTTINVRVWDGRFRVYFLDKEGKVMPPPAYDTTVIRREVTGKPDQTIALSPAGDYLAGRLLVQKPYVFKSYLVLKDSKEVLPPVTTSFMFSQPVVQK